MCIICGNGIQTGYICSGCAQKLIILPDDKLKEGYELAIKKGLSEKAEVLKQLLDGGQDGTKQVRPGESRIGKRLISTFIFI